MLWRSLKQRSVAITQRSPPLIWHYTIDSVKKLGVPLYQLWGLNPHKTPCTSFTIGLDAPEVMAEKTRHAEAYPILKVKLGTPQDIEIYPEPPRGHR